MNGTGTPLRLGVLGTSDIANRRVLPAALASPWIRVTAVASREPARAAVTARAAGARAADDYESLISAPDVDAVYIPLPCALHREWAAAALDAGKHVLIEKPMAVDAAGARALVEQANDLGLVLRENVMFVHHPAHAAARAMVRDHRIGELRTFSAAFAIPSPPAQNIRLDPTLGGGALRDVGIYPLRAARYFLGTGLVVAGATLRRCPVRGVDVGGQILLVSATGVLADLTFGFGQFYGGYYELWGSRGRARLDRAWTQPAWNPSVLRIEEDGHAEEMVLPPADQVAACLEEFASAVLDGPEDTDPDVDPLTGVDVAELIDEVERIAVVVDSASHIGADRVDRTDRQVDGR